MSDSTTDQTAVSGVYFAPDSAAVLHGAIVPGLNIIAAAVEALRSDLASDAALKTSWGNDPRAVLAARGFYADLQTNVLQNSGLPVEENWCVFSTINSACCGSVVI